MFFGSYNEHYNNNYRGLILKKISAFSIYVIGMMFFLLSTSQAEVSAAQDNKKKNVSKFMLSVDRVSNRLIAVGELGSISLSTDQASSWSKIDSPVDTSLTSVFMLNESTAWAAGHDATIIKTTNGGKHWEIMYSNIELDAPIFDIWFKDQKNGIAIGAYGLLLITNDGGINWKKEYLGEDDFHLFSIIEGNDEIFFASEMGGVYQFTDINNWKYFNTDYEGSLFNGIVLDDSRELLLFSMQGNILQGKDNSWNKVKLATSSVVNHSRYSKKWGIVAVGADGLIIHGNNPNELKINYLEDRLPIANVQQLDNGDLVIVGKMGIRIINYKKLVSGAL